MVFPLAQNKKTEMLGKQAQKVLKLLRACFGQFEG